MPIFRLLFVVIFTLSLSIAEGQTAKRYITVEHFTNTRCSSCAAGNPQLFTTLNNNPGEVHHISIHSEVPYANCIFYQHNTVGNNTRKNIYGINSTPTTYTNGLIRGAGGVNLLPQTRVNDLKNSTSPIRIQVSESINGNTISINVKVKTFETFSNTNLRMFVAIGEQYIAYNAPNGEGNHYNVFRTMLPNNGGQPFTPAPLGQEITQNFSVALHPDWQPSQLFATVFIQDTVTNEIWNSGTRFDLIVETTITGADCASASNGSASLSLSGGTPPYTYQWSNGNTGNSVNGLASGVYPVTVTDAGSRVYIDSINIPVTSTLSTQLTYTATTGNNGTANAIPTGGTPPYSFVWGNGNTTATATGLAEGFAVVTVTDANGCTKDDSIYVSRLTVTVDVMDVMCFGGADGSIKLSISGGFPPYNILWASSATGDSIGSLTAGNYLVTVTDDSSNAFEGNFEVGSPSDISITITTTDASGASDNGAAMAVITGGTGPYDLLWSNGLTTTDIMQLAGGTYTLTVTDANGCEKIATAVVGQLTGINEDVFAPLFEIYPNPFESSLVLSGVASLNGATVSVYNLLGERVLTQTIEDAGNTTRFDGQTLQTGTYLLVIEQAAQRHIIRVVKY